MEAPPPQELPSPPQMEYIIGLKSSAARVETTTPDRLVRRMLAEYGRGQIYEWLHAHRICKPVFDVDGKASQTTATALLAAALAGLATFFGGPELMPTVIIAASHGGEKLSYRLFVPGYRMRLGDIKKRILRLHLDGRSGGPFDPAIYSVNQKLRMVGSIKTTTDARNLKLVDADGRDVEPTADLLLATIAQVTEDQWPLLTEDDQPTQATATTTTTTTTLAAAQTGKRAAEPVQAEPVEAPRKRGRPRKEDTLPVEWRQVLDNLGFANIHALGSFADARGAGFGFTADNRRDCPCCAKPHDSNNWFIVKTTDGSFLVKSHSDKCRFRVVRPGATAEQVLSADPLTLEDKLQGMELEGTMTLVSQPGELHYHSFACRRRECLACDDDHGGSCEYGLEEVIRDAAWKLSNVAPTCPGSLFHTTSTLPSYLRAVLREPSCTSLTQLFLAANSDRLWCEQTLHDVRMWQGRSWLRITPKEFGNLSGDWLVFLLSQTRQMDAFSENAKQLKEAMNMCKAPAQQQALAQKILSTRSLACRGITFDDNQWLLGCNDCVIDLRTGVARAPKREDMVSITTGYDFLDTDNDPTPIYELMEKVYPVEEERNFIQAFAGYCLTGSCSEKLMLCSTDRRGGSNGKTTLKTVIRQALSKDCYMTEGKTALLYQSNNVRDVNAHDAGLLQYEYKRCTIFDEMSSKRTLDNETVKGLTSGDAHPAVRSAFGTTTRSMTWTSKFILIFNDGEAPQIRAEDSALMARMVVVHHRAKFCKDDATYDALTARGEDYVHRAATEAETEAIITPQRALAWALQGLDRYRREGFRRLPDSFVKWRQELMMEFDDVAAWAAEHVELRDGAHFTLADAHQSFSTTGVQLSKTRFSARLQKLHSGCFQQRKKIGGVYVYGVFENASLIP